MKKRYENPKEHEKCSKGAIKRYTDIKEREKTGESIKNSAAHKEALKNVKYPLKFCLTCGKKFIPNSGNHLYCPKCDSNLGYRTHRKLIILINVYR